MEIERIELIPDTNKYLVRLRCGHKAILDSEVQERLGEPIGEIMQKGSLVCPACGLPGRQARGEMAKVIPAAGKPGWVHARHYPRLTLKEVWNAIAPGTEIPPADRIVTIPLFVPHGRWLPYGEMLMLCQDQATESLPPNEEASRLAARPIRGNVVLISPQGDPRHPHSFSRPQNLSQLRSKASDVPMTYLALGDSIYSRKPDGGTVAQLFARLCRRDGQNAWKLVEKTLDKRTMSDIHVDVVKCSPSLVTVTIGGNDFLQNARRSAKEYVYQFQHDHRGLMQSIGDRYPNAVVVVGNIYRSQAEFRCGLEAALSDINRFIGDTLPDYGFKLADIHDAFRGHEQEYLCLGAELTLKGAIAIADLFEQAAFGQTR